jgi:hypothetical protein
MGYMGISMRGLIFMSLTVIRTLGTRPFLKRMPCPKPRRIERGWPDSPLLVGQVRNFSLSRRELMLLPSHLQLDIVG